MSVAEATPKHVSDSTPAKGCAITVHGVLPPPVTGMSACTQSMIDLMAARMPVEQYSWSNGGAQVTSWFRLSKAVRAQLSPWKLLLSRRQEHHVFYMPSNAGAAIIFNWLAILVARLRGYRCALHHHIYIYLNRYDWRMKVMDRLLGRDGLHIVLCPDMERRLRSLYDCRASIAIVPSTLQLLQSSFAPPAIDASDRSLSTPFCLGLIGNLSLAKGLDVAIDTLRELRRRGRDVRLILAGPAQTSEAGEHIEQARKDFGDNLDYRGPVYQEAKQRFFADLHAMIFPTRYPDAQPLVVTETFAFGRPVVSYGRGCIPAMMGARAAWSIDTGDDFVALAVPQIEAWMDNPQQYADDCRFARQRYEALLADAAQAVDDFVEWIGGNPPAGFVHRAQPTH
jgi:glycosyltransferase involved in cell wall biosynthesis